MIRSRGCFPETEEGWQDYNKQYDIAEDWGDDETVEWNEEVGNNEEEN